MEVLQTLAVIGVVQGGFLFLALLSRGWRQTVNSSLAVLSLIIAVRLLPGAFFRQTELFDGSWFRPLFDGLIFLFGPLQWLYIHDLTGRVPRKRVLRHFIPFLVIAIGGVLLPRSFLPVTGRIAAILVYPHIGAYQIGMLIKLRSFSREARDYVSNLEKVELLWFRMILGGYIILLFANLAADITAFFYPGGRWILWQSVIFADLFLLGINYLAIRNPEAHPEIQEIKVQIGRNLTEGKASYARNRLGDQTERKILDDLMGFMERSQAYRKEDLRISELAQDLGYSSHTISMVLSIHQQENFYQFVNSFRLGAAKEALRDPGQSGKSILQIACESGFHSKSTFNAFFRQATGQTPSQFRTSS